MLGGALVSLPNYTRREAIGPDVECAMISLQQWLVTKVVSGFLIAAVLAVTVLRIGYRMDTGSWHHTLTVLLGGVFGSITGILFTPKTTADDRKSSAFTASTGAFVGGFVLAKLDRLYEANVQSGVSEEFVIDVLLFSTAFGIGLLFTFVGRRADDLFQVK
jgi:Na+/H+-dicarboxylate symporter